MCSINLEGMFKKILNSKIHLRFIFNPLVRFFADNLGNYRAINDYERETPLIISLTSFPERFEDLTLSIYSIMKQNLKPDKIILWLGDNSDYKEINDLPYEITRFIKNGLEIRFVKDVRSYTKIVYALKEFPKALIVTADDDIYYPKNWLEKLYYSYAAHPEDIHVHRAHRVKIKRGGFAPYEEWDKHVEEESARYDNFLTGVGGVLYPPECFKKEVLREDVFLKNAPNADDIWLWIMALLSGRKIRVVKNHIKTLSCTNLYRQVFKKGRTLYAVNSKGGNDEQLKNLLKLYGQNIIAKLL